MHVIFPGIEIKDFEQIEAKQSSSILSIGYLARIAPEKGFHVLVEALCHLQEMKDIPPWQFKAAGYCAGYRRGYLEENRQRAITSGWGDRFDYIGEPDRAAKAKFLQELDVFSVPTTYQEPKGLYLLEAWASGLPTVQPAHGSFQELMDTTGGGLLFPPGDSKALADSLAILLRDAGQRQRLGDAGREAVRRHFTAKRMAEETAGLLQSLVAA